MSLTNLRNSFTVALQEFQRKRDPEFNAQAAYDGHLSSRYIVGEFVATDGHKYEVEVIIKRKQ